MNNGSFPVQKNPSRYFAHKKYESVGDDGDTNGLLAATYFYTCKVGKKISFESFQADAADFDEEKIG